MRDVGDQGAAATFVSNALRRHLALIIILGLLGSAAGVAAALKSGIRYTATASVLLNPLQGNPFAPDGRGEQLVNLETEAELVNTEAVAVLAGKKLRTDMSPDQMRELVSVENPTNTQVLRISFTGHSRDEALDGTQAFADSYLTYRGNRAKSISDARLARIRKQQTETQSKLAEVTDELADTPSGSARRAYLEERISALASQLASFETEVSTLAAADIDPGQVISPAALPIAAGGTDAVLFGAAGGLAGVLVGALIGLMRTRSDDRMHEPYDVEDAGIPLLGVIADRDRFGARGGTSRGRDLPEPYRELRTAIASSVDTPPVTIAIASTAANLSAAPEAAGIATGLARAGFSVVIVDTSGEATRLLAGSQPLPGLSGLLAGTADLRDILVQPDEDLVLLPFGQPQRGTMDQLLSAKMRATLQRLADWYQYVIVTGQPATSADGQALASLTDGVVLVAARRQTTLTDLKESVSALTRVQTYPIGAVVIDRRSNRSRPGSAAHRPLADPQRTRAGGGIRGPRGGLRPDRDPTVGRGGPPSGQPAGRPARARSRQTGERYYTNGDFTSPDPFPGHDTSANGPHTSPGNGRGSGRYAPHGYDLSNANGNGNGSSHSTPAAGRTALPDEL
jgi:polysaccharide biosynthesis transport protein